MNSAETITVAAAPNTDSLAEAGWLAGNRFTLLENGEAYFPALLADIAHAEREVVIETFILFDDKVGRQLQQVLVEAGKRGVSIDLTVDGYGSLDLGDEFIGRLVAAGVRLHIFDPRPRLLGMRTNIFRRLHRKIVAIDGRIAYVGGINFSADHLLDFGPRAKQDYAVRVEGPLAAEIQAFALAQVGKHHSPPWWRREIRWRRDRDSTGKALFVWRDNDAHRDDIERHYRIAIRAARREVIIANAYFFPGYRLLKQLRLAARRGVSVKLILQGQPDMEYVKFWAGLLYPPLLGSGVEIYEYMTRPLHAKIAAVDGNWCTIGSSNLEPLSLALNLEANVVVRDPSFVAEVEQALRGLLRECRRIDPQSVPSRNRWRSLVSTIGYHLTRYFPVLAPWLPLRAPLIKSIERRMHDSLLELRESR